jgi:hypothetical protein
MTKADPLEEPCAGELACTVLQTSGGSDPFAEFNRALKLAIRQRKNSLFYVTEHSAYIASVLTSVIATCVHSGVNAVDYLVAVQEHRQEVFANPSAWLPWNYQAALAPS